MADPSRTASVGDGLDGLKRVGLPASAHQRLIRGREHQVLTLTEEGWRQEAIADHLGITQAAVSKILRRVDERALRVVADQVAYRKMRGARHLEYLSREGRRGTRRLARCIRTSTVKRVRPRGVQTSTVKPRGRARRRRLVAAGTPTTGVAPLAVLGGHPDDEPADRVHAPWAARSATAAAVVCPRDQLSMPAEEGLGRDQGVPVTAYPSPEARGLGGQAPALGVGDPEPARTELLSEDAILFLERVNDVTRLLVDPARDGHDEELQHVGNRRHTGRA